MSQWKVKRRAPERKPTTQSLVFKFDEPTAITSYRVGSDGRVVLLEGGGRPAAPSSTWLTTSYSRAKGDKVVVKIPLADDQTSIHSWDALRRYKNLFIIDTNTVVLRGTTISIACIGIADIYGNPGDNPILRFACVCAMEFHNCVSKPENFAWSVLQSIILSSPDYSAEDHYAIVTDSDLGQHDAYNARSAHIFGNTFLAPNIDLLYASADVVRDVLNKLIRHCDREASAVRRTLESGKVPGAARPVLDGPCSHFRVFVFTVNMAPRTWIKFGMDMPFSMAPRK